MTQRLTSDSDINGEAGKATNGRHESYRFERVGNLQSEVRDVLEAKSDFVARIDYITEMMLCVLKPLTGVFLLSAMLLLSASQIVFADDGRDDFFEAKIRPLLIEHCVECHGDGKQESGLRLDSRQAILRGGDSGPAVSPDAAAESLFVEAIRYDGEIKMPPTGKLAENQINDLITWIQRGMSWPDDQTKSGHPSGGEEVQAHWAFQPVRPVTIPSMATTTEAITPIDAFIRSTLQSNGLESAREADPTTLIRRASLDLLGLPPTPDDVAKFMEHWHVDPNAAWESQIDRLLASPHYGERQARLWLDVARYADNKGYVFFEQKEYPWAWTYRDWVIAAFNQDLPFDDFVMRQLAADQIPEGQPQSFAALGFLTLGPRFMNNLHDVIDDRIDVVSRGLLGLTVTCARCHDHKFDPIPQSDYYSLYGVFRSSLEPMLRPLIQSPPDTESYREFAAGLQRRVDQLQAFVEKERGKMMRSARTRATEYLTAVYEKRNHPSTEDFMLLTDKDAINPAMVHRWEVYLKRMRRTNDPIWSHWNALFDLPEDSFPEQADLRLRELASTPEAHNALVRKAFSPPTLTQPPQSMREVADIYGRLLASVDSRWQKKLQEDPSATRLGDDEAEAIRGVLYANDSPAAVPRDLGWGFLDLLPDRPTQDAFKKLLGEVEKFSTSTPGAPPRGMVLVDAEHPYEPVIFRRGNPNREGARVERRFLHLLSDSSSTPFQLGSGRLELARAIVHPDNPLTARVFVNRIWQQHFGTGLVETSSDFGRRSSGPSHPELLDYLANQFVDGGQSVKQLHRQIMMSSTYRQSSRVTRKRQQQAMRVDSANRLLWKYPRRRLDFETTRDSLVAVSGDRDETVGGPAIDLIDAYSGRRTIYGFVNRMDLPVLLRTFDFPEPAATSPGREVTTIPQQALFFLNHRLVAETAGRILRRPDVSVLAEAAKLHRLHEILFGRRASADELELARRFLNRKIESTRPNAWQYGYGEVDESTGQVKQFNELAHWTGTRWQGGAKLPDEQLGWLFHESGGGHPGAADDRCFILRWTAPTSIDESKPILISGTLIHRPESGNGVRARVFSSPDGVLGQWKADASEVTTNLKISGIQREQPIDFVVDYQGQITHDEFEWPVTIRQAGGNTTWDSRMDFRGPQSDPWTNYVHALLMTNEFVHIE